LAVGCRALATGRAVKVREARDSSLTDVGFYGEENKERNV
jgi:hypothetical protein